ncbi:MAG TPA: pilus assembly PilX N-terminal domain-containing protein [Vicinamibacterales bacterium]|jgi:hypothetical protein|nr:pilus assembly PilX N-terminal domain-containing protein [Vicinamibacterales bacterium]
MPLLISMMALSVLTALAATLVLGTMTETAVAASYREGVETFYAAEAAVEFVIQDLALAPDWEGIATGEQVSSFVDGPPLGVRRVGAVLFDLAAATDDVVGATSDYDGDREYRIYAHGRLSDMLPGTATGSPYYVVVWITGVGATDVERQSTISLVGRAYGPTGSRRSIVVNMIRADSDEMVRIVSWHELR